MSALLLLQSIPSVGLKPQPTPSSPRRYIDCRAENGVTALHLAAIHGKLPCVHVLLAAGASMMVRTVDLDMLSTLSIPAGSTPLHLAAQKGQVAIVQAMLQVLLRRAAQSALLYEALGWNLTDEQDLEGNPC